MDEKVPHCENCALKRYSERRPNSLLARLWRWHTGWCPGYKAYQRWLAERKPEGTAPAT